MKAIAMKATLVLFKIDAGALCLVATTLFASADAQEGKENKPEVTARPTVRTALGVVREITEGDDYYTQA